MSSGVNYAAFMELVVATLAAIAPTRVITRTYRDFHQRDHNEELTPGIYSVVFVAPTRYPWDRCDDHGGEGPGATSLPVFGFKVYGQRVLDEEADGPAIEAAEVAMIDELEELADQLVRDETMEDVTARLLLKGMVNSQQLEAPYAWVAAEFEIGIE